MRLKFINYVSENLVLPAKNKTGIIDRADMPQINRADMKEFKRFLTKKGVKYNTSSKSPKQFKATQRHFSKTKIKKMMQKLEDDRNNAKPIIVSKDGFVIDGHHGWIAHLNMGLDIKVFEVLTDKKTLLDIMKEFPKSFFKKLHE